MLRRAIIPLTAIAILLACTNPLKVGQMSDASVAAFHQKLDQAQFHDIYAASSPDFQHASPEKDITELLNAVHTKLGNVASANRTNIYMSATTGGNFVRTTYDTTFAHGKGTETFNWMLANDQLTLVGYHIESRDLIVK
jgi:Protein of unknown function (DUF4019)